MAKYLDLEGLQSFKTKQDAANAATYATKESVPTKVSQLTNDSNYQTASQVASAISSAVASAYKYKGSKATTSDLPTTGNVAGDVWNVESDGMNYAWTGSAWDALGSTVDLSGYSKTSHTHSAATTSAAGFMSATDKAKLDGIAAGATKVTVDSALSSTSTNAIQNKAVYTALSGKSDASHTHSAATASAAGFLSASDKSKLDGIAAGANNYSLPTASGSTLGGVKTTSSVSSTSGLTACPIISGVPYYKDTTYSVATTSANGLMSSTDKTKLDGIATITTDEIDALFTS